MWSWLELAQEVDGLVVDLMRCRTGDLVFLGVFFLAEAHDAVFERKAGTAARARRVPVNGDLVAGDDTAPVTLVHDVVDGEPTSLFAGAGQRLTGIRIEDERDDPRLK